MENQPIIVRLATADDIRYSETITNEMEESAKARGTGIAKRSPAYIEKKMQEGKSVIAVTTEGTWVGFCYIEAWQHEKYVANSGLIVAPAFRKSGVATEIKRKIFELSRQKYPQAKIFGLTTGLAVMKINSELGYEPVTYSELTSDDEFWKGCQSCVNYDILMSKGRKNCICTGMLFDPAEAKIMAAELLRKAESSRKPELIAQLAKDAQEPRRKFKGNFKLFDRWIRFKQFVLLKSLRKKNENSNIEKKSFLTLFW
ncbi:GNAT family N-acetyltransferase [Chryseotalea sanaruensis]|uniref:GNAT family N-acetyltransferase n=1 Tax=Chryseotalea sanaruensis TaxID=2482724 RepID=UPI000F8E86D3|nr:GNAT family N-acetyltransferase [Chryseotalea sanaruensis]